jgi:hypothetical protein
MPSQSGGRIGRSPTGLGRPMFFSLSGPHHARCHGAFVATSPTRSRVHCQLGSMAPSSTRGGDAVPAHVPNWRNGSSGSIRVLANRICLPPRLSSRPEGVAVVPYVQRNLQMSIPAGDVPDVGTLPRRQRGAGFIPELMDSRGASPNSLTCPDQAMEFQDRSLGFHTLRQIGMNVLGKKLGGVRL